MLLKVSHIYKLPTLFERCEQATVKTVDLTSCAQLHKIATEFGATTLLYHCKQLISSYWNGLQDDGFLNMDLYVDTSLREMTVSVFTTKYYTIVIPVSF